MILPRRLLACATWAFAASFLGASLAHAQLTFKVSVDTSALLGTPASPFYLDFQLNDGAGIGNANNQAVISSFTFGGGSALSPATTFGGAAGTLSSSVTLTDSSAFNEFYQPFVPGAWLSFLVSLTGNVESGPTPDLFAFAILDSSLMNLATLSPGTDTFLQIDINSTAPAIATYASIDGAVPAPAIVPVPEPSTYGLCAAFALIAGGYYRRRRRTTTS